MKKSDITKKDEKDLYSELTELRKQFRDLRFGMASGAERNTLKARSLRRDIARILTELQSRKTLKKNI